jgi:hypothetical protein
MPGIVLEDDDIIENAQANKVIIQKAELTPSEEKALDDEGSQGEGDGTVADIDYEVEEDEPSPDVFEFLETEYSNEEKDGFSSTNTLNDKTIDTGIKVATIANKDVNDLVGEEPSGSLSGPRVDTMLATVKCRPGKAPWHAAAVATWFTEAGAPVPPTGASTAAGWLKWAKDTNRFIANPIVGACAIYGTTEKEVITAHHLGCVVQILDGDNAHNVICAEVVDTKLQLVQSNVSAILGFVLPAADPPPRPKLPVSAAGSPSFGPIKGLTPQEQSTGIHYFDGQLVFRQNNSSPWSKITYGPDPSYTDVQDSGCGLCSLGAVMRNLTGNAAITPGELAKKHGKYHVKNTGSSWSLMTEVPSLYKCKGEPIGKVKQKAVDTLLKGGYVTSVGSGKTPYSKGGHFIYIRRYDRAADVFYIGNSWYQGKSAASNTTPFTWEQLVAAGMKNSWAITKA